MGFNCLKARATSRRQFTFYHEIPRNSCYSFYRPRKDERLSRLWSHPVVLNTGPLDWESSALTEQFFVKTIFPVWFGSKVSLESFQLLLVLFIDRTLLLSKNIGIFSYLNYNRICKEEKKKFQTIAGIKL